jgi:uncharacterized protein YbjT (DUF2867 family)
MRVFVAGASGAIGRPLVRRLVEAGHEARVAAALEERARGPSSRFDPSCENKRACMYVSVRT